MITPAYLDGVQRYLFNDEQVEFTTRQRRVGPGGSILSPSVVVATDQRLLVIRDVLHLHIHENIDAIPYSNMTYVKYEHGLMSCAVSIGVLAFATPHAEGERNAYNVEGLRHHDAMQLIELIERMIIRFKQKAGESQQEERHPGYEVFGGRAPEPVCPTCHASNRRGSRYCSNCGSML